MKSPRLITTLSIAALLGFVAGSFSHPPSAAAQGQRHIYVQEVPPSQGLAGVAVYGNDVVGFSCVPGNDSAPRCFALTVK